MKRREFTRLAREYGFLTRAQAGRMYVYKKSKFITPCCWSASSDRVAGMTKEEAERLFVDLVIKEIL